MSAEIILINEPKQVCSFCGKGKGQVKRMFSNNEGRFICNECVAKAAKLIEEGETK